MSVWEADTTLYLAGYSFRDPIHPGYDACFDRVMHCLTSIPVVVDTTPFRICLYPIYD